MKIYLQKKEILNLFLNFSSAPFDCKGHYILAGDAIMTGDCLLSENWCFVALMQNDGNFCVYNTKNFAMGAHLWCTGLAGTDVNKAGFSTDGVFYMNGPSQGTIWYTGGAGTGSYLQLGNDAHLVSYAANNNGVWGTGVTSTC